MAHPLEAHSDAHAAREEAAYLRSELQKRLRVLEGASPEEQERAERATIEQYQKTPYHQTPATQPALSEAEVEHHRAIVLAIPPERHDEIIASLADIMLTKGIKNMLTVAERSGPHILDDAHRFLVAYLKAGYPAHGLWERDPLQRTLRMTLYEVRVARALPEDEQAADVVLTKMVQLYAGLLSFYDERERSGHSVLEIAVPEDAGTIGFYVAVPTQHKSAFEKMLTSLFPNVVFEEVPGDYNPFAESGEVVAYEGSLKEPWVLPIATFEDIKGDPLRVILEAFTRLEQQGVGAALQFTIAPAEDALARIETTLAKLDEGLSLHAAFREATRGTVASVLVEVGRAFKELAFSQKEEEKEEKKHTERNPAVRELLQKKMKTPLVSVGIRLVASAEQGAVAKTAAHDIIAAFSQFTNPLGNRFVFEAVARRRLAQMVRSFVLRSRAPARETILSLEELASVMHIPFDATAVPEAMRQSRSRESPLPQGVPTEGGVVLGEHVYQGVRTPVVMLPQDRLRHLYVIGQTGTGKTTLLKQLIVQDIRNGEGVCFIDPHGADVDEVLSQVPPERHDDVIYFDPANTAYPFGLNMLEYDPSRPEEKTFVVNELIAIFKKLYAHVPESMGPAFEQYFRNAALLVMEDPETGMTLLDIARVFADEVFREMKLRRCKNPTVVQFWRDIALKATGEMGLQNYAPYITNKIDIFTTNDIMRPIIAQERSTLNIREIMDTRKILLVNLSKGRLGDINAHLIGLVLVGKFLMAALARSGKGDYPPFYLYLDEFQNVTTDSISVILSEARKYKLALILAHQFLKQLEEPIQNAVFGNVGSMVAFRVGTHDAQELEPLFAPQFSAHDLANIDNYNAHVRLLAQGIPLKPFRIRTLPPTEGNPAIVEALKERSAKRYGRPRQEVEEEIRMRYGLELLSGSETATSHLPPALSWQ